MSEPPPAPELIALLQKAKAGDKGAFGAVYTQYFLPVFRYILRRVRDTKEAEDMAQTVFLKVYTSPAAFQNRERSPLAYFFTVARHLIIDQWRRNHRVEPMADDSEQEDFASMQEKVETTMTIEQGLQTLPEDQRRVLAMKFLDGYETRAIAVKLNKSEETVRQIQCRGLRKLREYLNHYGK